MFNLINPCIVYDVKSSDKQIDWEEVLRLKSYASNRSRFSEAYFIKKEKSKIEIRNKLKKEPKKKTTNLMTGEETGNHL